jgi:hypothetical protein
MYSSSGITAQKPVVGLSGFWPSQAEKGAKSAKFAQILSGAQQP